MDVGKIELRINMLSGQEFRIKARREWTAQRVKKKLSHDVGMSFYEMRLCSGCIELADSEVLDALFAADCVVLTLVRRHPQQATWLERVSAAPSELANAPEEMRGDVLVVSAAVRGHGNALRYALHTLKADRAFLLTEIIPYACGALRHVDAQLLGDRDFIAAAMQIDPFSFYYAAPEIKGDKRLLDKFSRPRVCRSLV